MQVAPDHVTCVRLILRQPSSAWTSFSLENIQIHPQRDQVRSAGAAVQGTHTRRRLGADTSRPSVTGRRVRVGRMLSAHQLHKLTRNETWALLLNWVTAASRNVDLFSRSCRTVTASLSVSVLATGWSQSYVDEV